MILDRVIRQRAAPNYLGMDRNRFDKEVRPLLTEVPLGAHGIGYDREDLDAWWEGYKAQFGRPGRSKGKICEPAQEESNFTTMAAARLTSDTTASASMNGLAPSPKKRRKRGSSAGNELSTLNGKTNFDRAMNACLGLPRPSI